MDATKFCRGCSRDLPGAAFYTRNGKPQHPCKECHGKRSAENRAAHPEKAAEYQRDWRRRNPEAARQHAKRWREANPDKTDAKRRRWREQNPERARELNARARQKREAVTRDNIPRIYFVRCESGFIKIGFASSDVLFRVAQIQTGNHEKLTLIATIDGASRPLEPLIHRQFEHLRHRGEWFRPAPELLAFIEAQASVRG